MRRSLIVLAAVLPLVLAPSLAPGAVAAPDRGNPYIVTLTDGVKATSLAQSLGVRPRHVYTTALSGFAATLTDAQVLALRRNPHVDRIEPDGQVHAQATQLDPTWNLDRIDERQPDLDSSYSWQHSGQGVTAYIIDTGLQTSHPEFTGRAAVAYDVFGGDGQDCNGHGTHLGSIVGGQRYGVAKDVALRSVRVLNCNGSGTFSGVIEGIDWVAGHHTGPAVALLALGGSYNEAINNATTGMADAGVFTAVASGASNTDACAFSPASAENVITTAASDGSDSRASFTNYGPCVDLYAPGVSVTGAWPGSGTATLSGTSMAAAHVTGAGAIYREVDPTSSSAEVNAWVISVSTRNVIKNNPANTPNRLLYKAPDL
ncbi:MAG: S8 family peptidase [Micromonosporaceae bacterium]